MQRLLITDMAKIIQDKTLTDIADAIRSKTNTTDTMKPTDMPAKINSITTGTKPTGIMYLTDNNTWYNVEKAAQAYTAIVVDDNRVTRELMGNTLVNYTDEDMYVFDSTVFAWNTGLATVSLPNATTLPKQAFYQATALHTAYTPNIQSCAINAFAGCRALEYFIQNKYECEYEGWYTFQDCSNIAKVDIRPTSSSSFMTTFNSCFALETIIIRCETGVPQAYDNLGLNSTLIASGTGYIYVPQATIESFRSATNWSDYADKMRAIEDYPDICAIPAEYQ